MCGPAPSINAVIAEAAARTESKPWWRLSDYAQQELASLSGMALEQWRYAWEWRIGLTNDNGRSIVATCISAIDLNGIRPLPSSRPEIQSYHYCIVRADIPPGSQCAQILHAAGESASPRPRPGTIAVALHAKDETHLKALSAALYEAGIERHEVVEASDDSRYPGQLMALGLYPTTNREAVRKVLSSLPLVR